MSLTSLFQLMVCFEIDGLVCIFISCTVFKDHVHLRSAHLYYQIIPLSSNVFLYFFKKLKKGYFYKHPYILLSIFNCTNFCDSSFMSFTFTKRSIQESMNNIFTSFNTCCSLSHAQHIRIIMFSS